jgi:hypothetical protein
VGSTEVFPLRKGSEEPVCGGFSDCDCDCDLDFLPILTDTNCRNPVAGGYTVAKRKRKKGIPGFRPTMWRVCLSLNAEIFTSVSFFFYYGADSHITWHPRPGWVFPGGQRKLQRKKRQ